MSRLTRDGMAEPVSRDQILRHERGQGNIIFPVQLTTSRIGNLTRLIHTLLYVMTIHTYIHTHMFTLLRVLSVVLVRGMTFPVTNLTQGSIRLLGRASALCISGQGEAEDELPERLIGNARIVKYDIRRAEPVD